MRQLSSSEDHCPPETTDEALARRARAGCEVAFAELLRRYRPLVHGKARTYFLAGGDRQDVVQEGMIGLYKAIRDFDPDRQPTFRPFADLCVTRQVLSAVKAATRHKHRLLNGSTSLHARDGGEGEPGLQERLADHRGDPLVHVSEATELAQLRAHCREVLSDLEAEVLQRYVAGESYAEIAATVGRRPKAIDNAVQRIRRKLEGYVAVREGSLV